MLLDKNPTIITIQALTLVGMHVRSTSDDMMTIDLWKRFMPRIKEIKHRVGNATYSVQLFDEVPIYNTQKIVGFTKWGAVEVSSTADIPEGMETFELESGLYAAFTHHGLTATFGQSMHYIFGTWLPDSGYTLANRPHFAFMDERYVGPTNPESEEDIYIPIEPIA